MEFQHYAIITLTGVASYLIYDRFFSDEGLELEDDEIKLAQSNLTNTGQIQTDPVSEETKDTQVYAQPYLPIYKET